MAIRKDYSGWPEVSQRLTSLFCTTENVDIPVVQREQFHRALSVHASLVVDPNADLTMEAPQAPSDADRHLESVFNATASWYYRDRGHHYHMLLSSLYLLFCPLSELTSRGTASGAAGTSS